MQNPLSAIKELTIITERRQFIEATRLTQYPADKHASFIVNFDTFNTMATITNIHDVQLTHHVKYAQ